MSDNTTPEPEPILLHADFSTTRHEQPDPGDVADHERERREKLSRERLLFLADMTADFRDDPFVPPPSPEAAERLISRGVAEHADRAVGFLLRHEAGLPTGGTSPTDTQEPTP